MREAIVEMCVTTLALLKLKSKPLSTKELAEGILGILKVKDVDGLVAEKVEFLVKYLEEYIDGN